MINEKPQYWSFSSCDTSSFNPKTYSISKTIIMKNLLTNSRSKYLLTLGVLAIGIGAISHKVVSYPSGGCIKGNQELTLNKGINKLFI